MTSHSKSLLITGVAGFLGRYIARLFSESGWSVSGIDTIPAENAPLSNLAFYKRLILPDRSLPELLKKIMPDVCIHCAGRASVGLSNSEPDSDFHAGTVLTFEVLNALRLNAPDCRFIFLSSAAVYGNPESLPVSESQTPAPLSPYGFHKWQCELLCREFAEIYGISTAIVRIFSAYGPGLRRQVIWDITRKALTENVITLLGTGNESRDFIHALDIAKALMIVAAGDDINGEIYNLATGQEVTIKELADCIMENLGKKAKLDFNGKIPQGTPLNWRADISRLRAMGFAPTIQIQDGIKTFTNWCKAELTGI